jgi:hypothetical protein
MFTSKQVIPAAKMIKQFSLISKLLSIQPQALLITQKSRESLVLVNAEIFEELLQLRLDLHAASEADCLHPTDSGFNQS